MNQEASNQNIPVLYGLSDRQKEMAYLSKKVERLSSATYILTNHLPDKEPLKWRLREIAINILSDITGSQSTSDKSQNVFYEYFRLEGVIEKINLLLKNFSLATTTELISSINVAVVSKEYESLRKRLEALSQPEFFSTLINIPEPERKSFSQLSSPTPEKKEVSDKNILLTKKPNVPEKKTPVRKKSSSRIYVATPIAKNSRRQAIIDIIKGQGWVAIKDIADKFPECSTKTIQRELNDLVSSNVLKKKGERRWSRYAYTGE